MQIHVHKDAWKQTLSRLKNNKLQGEIFLGSGLPWFRQKDNKVSRKTQTHGILLKSVFAELCYLLVFNFVTYKSEDIMECPMHYSK